jgi:hypothetical protein
MFDATSSINDTPWNNAETIMTRPYDVTTSISADGVLLLKTWKATYYLAPLSVDRANAIEGKWLLLGNGEIAPFRDAGDTEDTDVRALHIDDVLWLVQGDCPPFIARYLPEIVDFVANS